MSTLQLSLRERIQQLQDIVGTDAGNRGMKTLIVPGDLYEAARILSDNVPKTTLLLLSGFPCCVAHTPPTETDGPPGTLAVARAALALGWQNVVLVTDDCNRAVFQAALNTTIDDHGGASVLAQVQLETFAAVVTEHSSSNDDDDDDRMKQLAQQCDLLIACERAGPAKDGHCYTMRATDMTAAGLIAPLDRLVYLCRQSQEKNKKPFLAIGDGGNEMGMGKVIDAIRETIPDGDTIGCVVATDHLVAASVSNWGGYALAAGAALVRAAADATPDNNDETSLSSNSNKNAEWVAKCLPTVDEEIALLDRCVAAGCRDGVSGKLEATVDGMPLETSLQCLLDIREAASKFGILDCES